MIYCSVFSIFVIIIIVIIVLIILVIVIIMITIKTYPLLGHPILVRANFPVHAVLCQH
jgi:hypothetical protein